MSLWDEERIIEMREMKHPGNDSVKFNDHRIMIAKFVRKSKYKLMYLYIQFWMRITQFALI